MQLIRQILRRDKSFSAIVILVFAIGLSANTAVFTIVDNVLLKPLPYEKPDQIYSVRTIAARLRAVYPDLPVNANEFSVWQKGCPSCQQLALTSPGVGNLTGQGKPEQIGVVHVTPSFFGLLGVGPRHGRLLSTLDAEPGHEHVALITQPLWQTRYNSDPQIIGKSIHIDDEKYEIVGVLPKDFYFPKGDQLGGNITIAPNTGIFVPLVLSNRTLHPTGDFNYACLVRLKANKTSSQVAAEMNAGIAPFARQFDFDMRVKLIPLREQITGKVSAELWLLQLTVLGVLLIGCLNVGGLMLVRAIARSRETAIRLALGATTTNLLRRVLGEALILALSGAVVGTWVASYLTKILLRWAPHGLPRTEYIGLDWFTASVALGLGVVAAIVSSATVIFRIRHREPQEALRSVSHATTEQGRDKNTRAVLVGLQVALSTAALAIVALLIASFINVLHVNTGFNPNNILAFELSLPSRVYHTSAVRNQFYQNLISSLQQLPGVSSVALCTALPLEGEAWLDDLRRGDTPQDPNVPAPVVNYRAISPKYFQVMGVHVIEGRRFEPGDEGRSVAILSERAAKALWHKEDPIGGKVVVSDGDHTTLADIVGVVSDVRTASLDKDPTLMLYVPYWRFAPRAVSFVIRAGMSPVSLVPQIYKTVARLDPELSINRTQTMDQIVSRSLSNREFETSICAVFGVTALLLTALGIVGMVSYTTVRRRREMGIRVALGATPTEVAVIIVVWAMAPVIVGMIVGLGGAAIISWKAIGPMLFGINAVDPGIFASVGFVVIMVGLCACFVPAWQLTKLDAAQILRTQ